LLLHQKCVSTQLGEQTQTNQNQQHWINVQCYYTKSVLVHNYQSTQGQSSDTTLTKCKQEEKRIKQKNNEEKRIKQKNNIQTQ